MFIFLFGKDNYRSQQKLKEIIGHYQTIHRSGLNLRIYDLSTQVSSKFGWTSFQDFKNEFQQKSMFKEKKLIILKNAFSNDLFKKKFAKEKKIFLASEDIIIFFEENSVLKSDRLALFLKKNGEFQEFELLEGEKLKNWIKKEFKKEKIEIEQEALKELINFIGKDSWRMANEIKKLSHYIIKNNISGEARYKKAPVSKKDNLNSTFLKITDKEIKLLVKPRIEVGIFETIDSLAQRNKSKALKLIEDHLRKGDSPFYLLSMIGYQFRNLIIIKKNEDYFNSPGLISQKTGISFYLVKKLMKLTQNFSLEELKKIFQKIFEADLDIKTGKIDPEQGIKMLIARI